MPATQAAGLAESMQLLPALGFTLLLVIAAGAFAAAGSLAAAIVPEGGRSSLARS